MGYLKADCVKLIMCLIWEPIEKHPGEMDNCKSDFLEVVEGPFKKWVDRKLRHQTACGYELISQYEIQDVERKCFS